MDQIKNIQKKYCTQAMFYAIAVAVILIIIGEKTVGKGLVLGSLFSVINFIILGRSLPAKLLKAHSKQKARTLAFSSILLRFSILTIPLVISMKVEAVHFIGVAIGLFMVQLTMLFDELILNRLLPLKKA